MSDNSIEENDVRRAMMRSAKKKMLLCDDNKIGKKYLNNLCSISEFDEIISNVKIPEEIRLHMK